MTDAEKQELSRLRQYMALCSLGDRPHAPSVAKLRRLWELEDKERQR